MFESLRSRLALSNLLITLLGLLAVVGVFTQLLGNRSEELKRAELRRQSQAVARQIETYFKRRGGPGQPLETMVINASSLLQERIVILSAQTQRPSIDSARKTPFVRGSWRPYDLEALKGGTTFSASLKSKNLVAFQTPVVGTRGHVVGAVLLIAAVTDVRPDLGSLLRIATIALGTALLVWLAIGFFFTYSISRPLLQITQATESIARGNYGARVRVRGHGEIGRLAVSFNSMGRQIQQSNQVLKDFLANVSHDLRTPLTIVSGFSQALLDGTARQEDAVTTAQVIHDEAQRMERLVDDLLQLTRLESGLLKLELHPAQVRAFVQSTVDRVERGHTDVAHADIRNLVPADLPVVRIDEERLERALRNLLDNALEYTPAGGRISVTARPDNTQWIEISVSDTGAGIPHEDLPRIFERFYRSDKSRGRVKGHSGLGLAIVREIVEAHGGTLSVQSEPGHGTTFRFTIPVALGVERRLEPPAAAEAVRHATS